MSRRLAVLPVALLVVVAWTNARAQVYPSPLNPLHWSVRPSATSGYLPAPDDGPIGDYSVYGNPGTDGQNTYAPDRYHQVYRL